MPWTTVSAPLRRMGHTSALATASAAAARSRSRAARPGGAPGATRPPLLELALRVVVVVAAHQPRERRLHALLRLGERHDLRARDNACVRVCVAVGSAAKRRARAGRWRRQSAP